MTLDLDPHRRAVVRLLHLVAVRRKVLGKHVPYRAVVLDNEDASVTRHDVHP
ncbi:hypothetical protein D3C83_05350 [compost metagenome]